PPPPPPALCNASPEASPGRPHLVCLPGERVAILLWTPPVLSTAALLPRTGWPLQCIASSAAWAEPAGAAADRATSASLRQSPHGSHRHGRGRWDTPGAAGASGGQWPAAGAGSSRRRADIAMSRRLPS